MVITATAGASAADEDRAHATACHLYHAGCALHVAHQTHVDAWITPPLATGSTRRSPTTSRSSETATPRTCGDAPLDARRAPKPRQPFDQGAATHDHLPHCVAQHPGRIAPD